MGWARLGLSRPSLLVFLALCLVVVVVVEERLGCWNPRTASADDGSSKISRIMEEVCEGFRPLGPWVRGELVGPELRTVPSGPDPLHHSGSPKRPHTP